MSYIFNRINLVVAIVMVMLIAMSMNEVVKYAQNLSFANKTAYAQWFVNQKKVFSSQVECQRATLSICSYEECDYVPSGDAFEKVCDSSAKKGWQPTAVAIPAAYQNIRSIRFTTGTETSHVTLEVDPAINSIRRISDIATEPADVARTITSSDITLLVNKMILYEFITTSKNLALPKDTDPKVTTYTVTVVSQESTPTGSSSTTYTAACVQTSCPRNLTDLTNDIQRLWGE